MLQPYYTIINFDNIAKAFILVILMIWLPNMTQNTLQMLLFHYAALVLFGLSFVFDKEREFKEPFIFIIFLLSICLSLILNVAGYPIGMVHIISAGLMFYALVRNIRDENSLIKILMIVGGINIIVSLLQMAGINILYTLTTDNPAVQNSHYSHPGFMGRNYHLSYFLAGVAPLSFIINKKLGILSLVLALIFAIVMKSFACFIGISTAIIYLVWTRRYIKPRVFLSGVFVLLILFGGILHKKIINKIQIRLPSYNYIIQESLVNPLIGHGIGTFETKENIQTFDSSYNQFLRIVYEYGLVPAVLLGYAFIKFLSRLQPRNCYFNASLIALFVYPLFHETLRFGRLTLIYVVIFSIITISTMKLREVT